MSDISIIIVNYKVKEYIIPCIESIKKQTSKSLSYEILVIDNNSNDGSIEAIKSQFHDVKIYRNKKNIGFSKAVNQGSEKTTGRYLFILNPDTKLIEDTVSDLYALLEKHRTMAIVGPSLVTKSGYKQQSFWKNPTLINTILSIYHLDFFNLIKNYKYKNHNKLLSVDAVSGGAFLVRKKIFQKVKGFNNNLFWMEDMDLCKRVKNVGFEIIYYPKTKIIHHGGKSVEKNWRVAISNQLLSKIKYFKMYHSGMETFILKAAILIIAMIKLIIFISLSPFGTSYKMKKRGYFVVVKAILTNYYSLKL